MHLRSCVMRPPRLLIYTSCGARLRTSYFQVGEAGHTRTDRHARYSVLYYERAAAIGRFSNGLLPVEYHTANPSFLRSNK